RAAFNPVTMSAGLLTVALLVVFLAGWPVLVTVLVMKKLPAAVYVWAALTVKTPVWLFTPTAAFVGDVPSPKSTIAEYRFKFPIPAGSVNVATVRDPVEIPSIALMV